MAEMKRHRIANAWTMTKEHILRLLSDAGFFVRAPIGYNWTIDPSGRDCEFTQPPEAHTPGCQCCPSSQLSPPDIRDQLVDDVLMTMTNEELHGVGSKLSDEQLDQMRAVARERNDCSTDSAPSGTT